MTRQDSNGFATSAPAPTCRICREGITNHFWRSSEGADYWRCRRCEATFLDQSRLLSHEEELPRYSQHQNHAGDEGYITFLNTLVTPLLARLAPALTGLDFGCGPGPVLAGLLRSAGHTVFTYDPHFQPDQTVLASTYDFITTTEVAEHFHQPYEEFCRLSHLLRPGGLLAVMTCFQTEDTRFPDWYYRRDPTHVTFYRENTFRWLAGHFAWSCEFPCRNVVFLRKA